MPRQHTTNDPTYRANQRKPDMPRQHTTNDPTYRANRTALLKDNPPCYRCGKPADTADHIQPIFQGVVFGFVARSCK